MHRFLALVFCFLLLSGGASAEFIFADSAGGEDAAPEVTAAPADEVESGGFIFSSNVEQGTTQASPEPAEAVEILITAAGDVTIGGNMRKNPSSNMYTKIIDAIEGDMSYFFANVQEYFAQDDLTIVNFEGTLTTATQHKDNKFCFRAPQEHVEMLTLGSVEAVAFENNHVMDFYETGYNDTIEMFNSRGIVYAAEDDIGVFTTKGVTIALLAYQTFDNQYPRLLEKVPQDVALAKAQYDIVIVSYHWGDEEKFKPNDNQVKLGRLTIDAGADLVLGHHSHRINPIEYYSGRYIVYSLANCSFSGNTKPSNMDTFLYQQKFTVTEGVATVGDFRIIPCSISSITAQSGAVSGQNDLVVTPFAPDSKAAQRVIDTMLENGGKLEHAVQSYPTQWQ